MSIFKIDSGKAIEVEPTTFQQLGLLERRDIQSILRESIAVVAPDTMVLTEEFSDWTAGHRRIDLLCLRKDGGLAIVELKRTEDGGHMELQALRYAAMASAMTFQEAVRAHEEYLRNNGVKDDAERRILEFLEWTDSTSPSLTPDVSIILVSAEFSKEITTTVLWLNDRDLDITCVRLRPYSVDGKVLLNAEQIIPLPEAAEYQVRVRQKEREERNSRAQERDLTRFEVKIGDETITNVPKRRLAFYAVREAVKAGAAPLQVVPLARAWIAVPGKVTGSEFKKKAETERTADSSTSEIRRFFTEDNELLYHQGFTYALTKMWGADTPETVTKIIKDNNLTHMSFQAISG